MAAGSPLAITCAVDHHRQVVGQREDGVDVVLDQHHGVMGLQACSSNSTMLSASATPMPASGSSSSSTCGSVAKRHGDLELTLLAVAGWHRR
jgi:hypothetical protein